MGTDKITHSALVGYTLISNTELNYLQQKAHATNVAKELTEEFFRLNSKLEDYPEALQQIKEFLQTNIEIEINWSDGKNEIYPWLEVTTKHGEITERGCYSLAFVRNLLIDKLSTYSAEQLQKVIEFTSIISQAVSNQLRPEVNSEKKTEFKSPDNEANLLSAKIIDFRTKYPEIAKDKSDIEILDILLNNYDTAWINADICKEVHLLLSNEGLTGETIQGMLRHYIIDNRQQVQLLCTRSSQLREIGELLDQQGFKHSNIIVNISSLIAYCNGLAHNGYCRNT